MDRADRERERRLAFRWLVTGIVLLISALPIFPLVEWIGRAGLWLGGFEAFLTALLASGVAFIGGSACLVMAFVHEAASDPR